MTRRPDRGSLGSRLPSTVAVAMTTTALILAGAAPTAAQHEGHSSYAGTGSAEVKTLTTDEVRSLLEGEGMGLARPAELNGYPGPRHVLDLADSLALTGSQKEATEVVLQRMSAAARELGRRIVDAESELDAAFASDGPGAETLRRLVTDLARMRGELRWVHLRAHLEMVEILTTHQRHEYDRLRGYGGHEHGG